MNEQRMAVSAIETAAVIVLHGRAGVSFEGLYAHESGGKPTPESLDDAARGTATLVAEAARLLAKEGVPIRRLSVGASPTLRATCKLLREGEFPEITEIHPGHCAN